MNKKIKSDKLIKNTSLALGFFDGIHTGHEKVLMNTLNLSKKLGTQSCVLTFKNHPIEIIKNITPEYITIAEERCEKFKKMGFDIVIMQDFTSAISSMSPEEYFYNIILKLSPKSITIGYNHKFGAKQQGDENFLLNMSKKHDFILNVIPPVKSKNEVISSTLIRNAIKNGDVKKALKLMKQPYSVESIVIRGMQRGRTINFPTANIEFPKYKIVPEFGVYAGYVYIENKKLHAVANVGIRPTFGDLNNPLIEIYIFDYSGNLYEKKIKFEFIEKIRNEIKFNSVEQLKEQIAKDIVYAKKILEKDKFTIFDVL